MKILQERNPQMFQTIEQAKNNGKALPDLVKEMTQNATPQQRQSLINQAKAIGISDDILSQL